MSASTIGGVPRIVTRVSLFSGKQTTPSALYGRLRLAAKGVCDGAYLFRAVSGSLSGAYSLVERASSLTDIAFTFLEEERSERTQTLLHQSLILFGNQARMHYALEGSARLAVHLSKMALAAELFGVAERLREMRLVELPVVLHVHRDSVLRLACEQIGEEFFGWFGQKAVFCLRSRR